MKCPVHLPIFPPFHHPFSSPLVISPRKIITKMLPKGGPMMCLGRRKCWLVGGSALLKLGPREKIREPHPAWLILDNYHGKPMVFWGAVRVRSDVSWCFLIFPINCGSSEIWVDPLQTRESGMQHRHSEHHQRNITCWKTGCAIEIRTMWESSSTSTNKRAGNMQLIWVWK